VKINTGIEEEIPKEDLSESDSEDDGRGWITQNNINAVLNHALHTKEN